MVLCDDPREDRVISIFAGCLANHERAHSQECRCDERLKAKAEGTTRLPYTRLRGGLEHLKIETRLLDERFVSVMGECVM